jgi:hypothetical protein
VCFEHFRLGRPLAVLGLQFLPELAVVAPVSLQGCVDGVELRRAKATAGEATKKVKP